MTPVLLIAILCGLALWALFRRWQTGRGSPQFVLGILPAAVLLVAIPIPIAAWRLIRAFQEIAQRGQGGLDYLRPIVTHIVSVSRVGAAALLLVMAASAALQALALRSRRAGDPSPDSGLRGWSWRTLTVLGSILPVLLVGLLSHLANAVPPLVVRLGTPQGPQAAAAFEAEGFQTVEEASSWISTQLTIAVSGGVLLSAVVGIFAILNLAAVGSGSEPRVLRRYSWVVLAIVCLWSLWSVFRLTADINAFRLPL